MSKDKKHKSVTPPEFPDPLYVTNEGDESEPIYVGNVSDEVSMLEHAKVVAVYELRDVLRVNRKTTLDPL